MKKVIIPLVIALVVAVPMFAVYASRAGQTASHHEGMMQAGASCPAMQGACAGMAACPDNHQDTCKDGSSCPSHDMAKQAPKASAKVVSAVCPVMGNKIPDITKAAGKSVYKGTTYYFCCGGCKPKFDANPAKYVKVVSAVCPVMGTKIPDVTKAAGKSVYNGKTYYFCCAMCKPKFDANPAKYVK